MNKAQKEAIENYKRQAYKRLPEAVISAQSQLNRLQKIAHRLHNLGVAECNYGLTAYQETREANLQKEAAGLAKEIGAELYIQGDPRGWPLYLLFPGDGATENSYTNGIGIPPY